MNRCQRDTRADRALDAGVCQTERSRHCHPAVITLYRAIADYLIRP